MRSHTTCDSSRPSSDSSARPGFTLVEVLIAVMLIQLGLLALGAGCAVVVRQTTLLRARVTALELASNRVEALAAVGCTASFGTAVGPLGFRESWSASLVPVATRELQDSVSFTVQGEARAVVLRTRRPC